MYIMMSIVYFLMYILIINMYIMMSLMYFTMYILIIEMYIMMNIRIDISVLPFTLGKQRFESGERFPVSFAACPTCRDF
jgi:hypothetical protein